MAKNYPVWARCVIDPTSFEHEQARLGQIWTLLGVVTDVANDGDWFRTIPGGWSIFVQQFGEDLRGFENFVHTVFTHFDGAWDSGTLAKAKLNE